MKVLITGANGFIGSHLTEALLDKGYSVRCLLRKTSDLSWLAPLEEKSSGRLEFVYGDICDKESLRAVVGDVDYVYHVAGLVKAHRPQRYYEVNVEGTRNLAEVTRDISPNIKKFVFFSSLAASGPSDDGHLLKELETSHPVTDYGKSKRDAEDLLKNDFSSKLPVVVIRPPIIYGPRDRGFYFYFKIVKKGIIPVTGKKISACFVSDLVKGAILAAESKASDSQVYFISDPVPFSPESIGRTIAKFLQVDAKKIKVPAFIVMAAGFLSQFISDLSGKITIFNIQKAREMVQPYWVCDVSKARAELGFKASIDIEEGIRITVDWYKKRGWL
ncbi:MAG: SDR family NAD(P)-dependent oxidoreductase [bacterium]